MEVSIQNLIEEFTAVVLEKDELEFRHMSELSFNCNNSLISKILRKTDSPVATT